MEFNSETWRSKFSTERDKEISLRERMLNDLVTNVLPGKRKDEIEHLLGPSIESNWFGTMHSDLMYYMGPERDHFVAIDSEWLLIWLDENKRFERYRVTND